MIQKSVIEVMEEVLGAAEIVASDSLSRKYSNYLAELRKQVAADDPSTRRSYELYIAWGYFYDAGREWSEQVIDRRAIPRSKAKAVEMAVRVFGVSYGRHKEPKPSIAAWFAKHEKRFDILVEAARWPDRSDDSGIFQMGTFTVHDTVGSSDKELQSLKSVIDMTLKGIKKSGLPGLLQQSKGILYLVGQLQRKNWAAWYMESKDAIYLRPKIRGQSTQDIARTLIHEICHRYWKKGALPQSTKKAWAEHHRKMLRSKPSVYLPEVGVEIKDLVVNNKHVKVSRYVDGKAELTNVKNDQLVGLVTTGELKAWIADVEHRGTFPSMYAASDVEEHFCESVAFKGMGQLSPSNLEAFDEIILGKKAQEVRVSAGYYSTDKKRMTSAGLNNVLSRWVAAGDKVYDNSMPIMVEAKTLWPLREYTWTRERSRPGNARVGGKLVEMSGPLKWDALYEDMKARGWDRKEPLHLEFGKNGKMKVGEGNHRLAIAVKLGLRDIPVMFHFRQNVTKSAQEDSVIEVTKPAVKTAVENTPTAEKKKMSPDEEKSVSDLLTMLGF